MSPPTLDSDIDIEPQQSDSFKPVLLDPENKNWKIRFFEAD